MENHNSPNYDAKEDAERGERAAEALRVANNWEPARPEHLVALKLIDFDKMERAADYADEWFVHDGKAMRVFYVCNRF